MAVREKARSIVQRSERFYILNKREVNKQERYGKIHG